MRGVHIVMNSYVRCSHRDGQVSGTAVSAQFCGRQGIKKERKNERLHGRKERRDGGTTETSGPN